MENITFNHIYTLGNIVFENELYQHFHYPGMLVRYDSNFIEFKTMPSNDEFKGAFTYLRDYHKRHGQSHVKFTFPENQKPSEEFLEYLNDNDFLYGYNELYVIQPNQFPRLKDDPDINITPVTSENLDAFLTLQYTFDEEFGDEFAEQKVALHQRNFKDEKIMQLLAYYKGLPAGSVDIIISEDTAEIDQLSVLESMQRKGIGGQLQKFVMDHFPQKTVILVADGNDTPREMYLKQNYQYVGFEYECIKVFDS
ncbi:GNAT family N-acetyltransferase [Heyndrickxia sporothermodurans]|uniref:GNAT family N-acetyltransferase n=1 Tax=Heyndrickxia sporothermodurans TaxID=46224 RepID=A0AB37HA60_9BACI|nr:GNAT family N-acetyltransferase [Heyndrickxia sporothermodurans]MBL5771664.1 GNAT family N-acetyltransferase [Heyndrickxia sporothermodurans]MBL5775291.1 GNAT family N-acetyltransferase [Heyndrickxia sporothermodurans]MBL5782419.1 GNAT family N-acetyltransferase [Heyndrickxia sporothermodurans]MBL5794233.1 GNAT family N-acetyltransferase [Heyndrickxia sporothermodurans]MBL5796693.1 GNAT family N-acetyltransferase [Heyndrickxia sporothermodurans]